MIQTLTLLALAGILAGDLLAQNTPPRATPVRPAGGQGSEQSVQNPPNVILIMADDLGAECISSYGATSYSTPNIDALAKSGLRFTNAHSQPLCTPTRVELMTGMCNARNYVGFSLLPRGSRTFGHAMKSRGYATGVFGKWQLLGAEHYPDEIRGTGTHPKHAGFDTWCLWQVEKLGKRFWNPTLTTPAGTRPYGDDRYGPDVVCDALLDFVTTNRQRPFFAYYPMILTHSPFIQAPPRPDGTPKSHVMHFKSMVEHTDKIVGRITQKLDELGLTENTVVIFTGDNGTHRKIKSMRGNRSVQGGKGATTVYGTHVPLVLRWPAGSGARGKYSELFHVRDLHATILDLAGTPMMPPVRADSWSIAKKLRGLKCGRRDWIRFWYHPRPKTRQKSEAVWWVMGERYKLYSDGRLFDWLKDPNEQTPIDVATVPDAVELQKQLTLMPRRG